MDGLVKGTMKEAIHIYISDCFVFQFHSMYHYISPTMSPSLISFMMVVYTVLDEQLIICFVLFSLFNEPYGNVYYPSLSDKF